jgi:HSP20 family protein
MCKVNSPLYPAGQKAPVRLSKTGGGETHWIPNTDVFINSDHCLVIHVELAGMRKDDLEITIDGNRLMISGQRPDGGRSKTSKCSFLVMEINYGPFECVIEIPPGYELSQAKAAYQNGFLRVEVPAQAQRAPTKLALMAEGVSK